MKDALKHSFEVLLKNGEYAEAEKLLVPYMKENPDDWDAKLLYGTCRMMQGDAETAKLVHQQAQDHFECGRDIPEEQKSFWDKYKKLIEKTYKETPKQKKSASGIWAWILCILLAAIGTIAAIGTQKIWDVVGLLLEQRDCRGPGSPECRGVGCPECRIVGIPISEDGQRKNQAHTGGWQ